MGKIPTRLQKLFDRVADCTRCKREKNPLRHVFGGGKFKDPKFFFLFINPTHKNHSSQPTYAGRRSYPFIGVRHFYRWLAEAGFGDTKLIAKMYGTGWQVEDEEKIEKSLQDSDVYISNFVKCAQPHPRYPARTVMKETLPLIAEELAIINPQYIVTFGLPPLEMLTNISHKMRDIFRTLEGNKYQPLLSIPLNRKQYQILPCYFPLGHGNPPKAHKMLSYIKKHF